MEVEEQLLNHRAANPRARFDGQEKKLIEVAEDERMAGVVNTIETTPKRLVTSKEKQAAAPSVATSNTAAATTTAGQPKAVSKTPATKIAPETTAITTTTTAIKVATATTLESTIANKRKIKDEDDRPPTKRPRGRPKKGRKAKVVINEAPTQRLDVFVFGDGSNGELGLGSIGNVVNVKRPRLNPNLSAAEVGVVQLAVGGMHTVALTHDNKILTWGVNDQCALGRATTDVDKILHDIDDASDDAKDDEDDTGIDPRESTPTEVSLENVPAGTVFTQIAAGDSLTLAVTDDGLVYGCGTFRGNDGILGFSPTIHIQPTLLLLPTLTSITHVACGDNHALALSASGAVLAWGAAEQGQLGRRVMARTRLNALLPRAIALAPRTAIAAVACGAYHAFALDRAGAVWAWGLNTYGATGLPLDSDGVVHAPTRAPGLAGRAVRALVGGSHHSLARTAAGQCLAWGRADGAQCGIAAGGMRAGDVERDARGGAGALRAPAAVQGVGRVVHVAAGSDTSIVVNAAGEAYAWGFSANYQTGLGTVEEVDVPRRIENQAVRGRRMVWAGAGGQFGVLAAVAEGGGVG
ncbi:hypothetical protein MMC11_002828 [Xylographa trunciseda]|nr:hypothetical protein [Xylographa trunciseda]